MAIKEFIIHDENNNNSISSNNVIKNPDNETSKDILVKPKKDIMLSGSNYQNIIQNVGVRITKITKNTNLITAPIFSNMFESSSKIVFTKSLCKPAIFVAFFPKPIVLLHRKL